ncbi:MAG: acid phosphatase [Acidimicrobiales bacterium]|nr:acid phosphatase [Acidimicrobiales bacterium]
MLALAAALVGCSSSSGGSSPPTSASKPPTGARLIVMIEENHAYSQVIGRPEAPAINALANASVSLTQMFATTHPSLPNYLALTSGSTQGATNDCGTCTYDAENIFNQMQQAGISWKVYAQGYAGNCYLGKDQGNFVRRHVPALSFRNVIDDPAACGKVVSMDRLLPDLASGALPTVSFVVPDLANDMHGTGHADNETSLVRAADALLATVLGATKSSPAWKPGSRFVLTWDEGGGSLHEKRTSCCGARSHGGHIPTFVLGPGLPAGVDVTDTDQYDLLRSIENRLGLPLLGQAADATSHDVPALVHG